MYVILQDFIRDGKFEYSMWPVVYMTYEEAQEALPHVREQTEGRYGLLIFMLTYPT